MNFQTRRAIQEFQAILGREVKGTIGYKFYDID